MAYFVQMFVILLPFDGAVGEGHGLVLNYVRSWARDLPFVLFQCNRGNLTRGLLLILAELWVQLRPLSIESVALFTRQRGSGGIVGLVPDLDGDFGVSEQVVIPVGIGWCATFGGEDEQAVAIAQVHHRARAVLSALCAGGREQKQRSAFPHTADLSSIRPELLNQLAIPVIHVRHMFSSKKIDAASVGIPVA